MGYLQIHNPMEDFIVELPYIALHYLQHGSFVYAGDYHLSGQIDPRTPDVAVHSDGTMHILPIENDSDRDGLKDAEEVHFDTNPNNPDSNSDGVGDGAELAKAYATAIDNLPREPQTEGFWVKDYSMWGFEYCAICGETPNMGYLEINNPVTNDSLRILCVALHYMQHGSFAYDGSEHGNGRVDPIQLASLFGNTPTEVEEQTQSVPKGFSLQQNYPNPFSANSRVGEKPGTLIQYQIGGYEPVHVELEVFNLLGQTVNILVNERKSIGQHQVVWDGRDKHGEILPTGLYFYRLKAGGFIDIKKTIRSF